MTDDIPTTVVYLLQQGLAYAWPNVLQPCLLCAASLALLLVLFAPPGVGAGDDTL